MKAGAGSKRARDRWVFIAVTVGFVVTIALVTRDFYKSLSDDGSRAPSLGLPSSSSGVGVVAPTRITASVALPTSLSEQARGLSLLRADAATGSSAEPIASTPPWNIEYLPPILNSMVKFYASNLARNSLDVMLPPVQYAALSCARLVDRHMQEYRTASSRVDFTRPPKYKMPWYYHDPYPLCGRYLLTHFFSGLPVVVHRVVVAELSARGFTPDSQMQVAHVTAGTVSEKDISVEHCGTCREKGPEEGGACNSDILLHARLLSNDEVVAAEVLPATNENGLWRHRVRFLLRDPGEYTLEVKAVHVNGSSSNASFPKSLGVIGIRASDHNRKSFKYNLACDLQRHVYGSPLRVVAVRPSKELSSAANEGSSRGRVSGALLPPCTNRTYVQEIGAGRWLRIPYGAKCDQHEGGKVCIGDPTWMTDACGFNTELVWAPDSCRMRVFTPPKGPETSCLRRGRSGFVLFVGDSVTREYVQNCRLFDLRGAKLVCLFANIALEGQHYSSDYARAVVKAMMESLQSNRPGVFATNLGIHHMIGKSSTEQWMELIDVFVEAWKRERIQILETGTEKWLLEKAVWLGPPTIHYARHGMGFQRAALWDAIAWKRLEPLGFRRLYAIPPTLGRTEGTWDGLHYAAYKGKVQSPWRNKAAPVLLWNGGVANMLFNAFLNIVCDDV